MSIRQSMLAGAMAVAVLPAPAFAEQARAGELAERLNDPATQYVVAGMLSAMSKAVLELRVKPLADAMGGMGGRPMRDFPPDATVADVSGVNQAEVRERLIEEVPRMMSAMGGMAGALEQLKPQLEEMARRMKPTKPRD